MELFEQKDYSADSTYFSSVDPVIFAIEVEGNIYHSCPIKKEKERDAALEQDI